MLKISRESEIGLINILIDHDIISGKDLPKIKKLSTEANKSQIDAVFELKLTDENKILDVLIKEQNLEIVDLSKVEVNDDVKSVLPSNYIKMNFIAPFKVEGKVLHIAIPDSSKLSLMRNLKAITKKNIELHAATVSQISSFVEKLLSESGNVTTESIRQENKQKTKTFDSDLGEAGEVLGRLRGRRARDHAGRGAWHCESSHLRHGQGKPIGGRVLLPPKQGLLYILPLK